MGSTVLIQPGIALLHSFLGLSSHHHYAKMPKKANIFESFFHSAIQQFKEAFGIMDTNKDGLLSSDDLVAAFAAHGKNIGGGEARAMLDEVDGPMNFTQMVTLFASSEGDGAFAEMKIDEGMI